MLPYINTMLLLPKYLDLCMALYLLVIYDHPGVIDTYDLPTSINLIILSTHDNDLYTGP